MADPKLNDEEGRIAALCRYEVLDTAEEKPFEKITSLVRTILDVPISAVSLVDTHRQWFKSRQGVDASETPRDVSFCTFTIQTREPMIVTNALEDERFANNPLVTGAPFIRSYAGSPLKTPDGYNLGALCAIDTKPRLFEPKQIEVLKNLANLVVDELELRRIASADHLTGALTRRGWIAEAEREIDRCKRYGRPAAIAVLDIDHFKSINDRHGHPVGDQVLKEVARCCIEKMRASDSFGRIGGEEFVVLLSETTEDDAVHCAERFRQCIENLDIQATETLKVTASFGVAPYSAEIEGPDQWLAVADRALYAAKRGGRNKCICAGRLTTLRKKVSA
ncbi:MAG: sensor domain-containing diguanylate cyclase [Candidatus Zixiibacteriota bacterium]|nr:MAG: sensor domain-containing diguanylate cyclase [candidate division Zixibacteria bacterium]